MSDLETQILPRLVLVTLGLRVFSIERDLVTNADIARWVHATGSAPAGWRDGDPRAVAVGVSCQDAEAFAVWQGMRLPTDDEWAEAALGAIASTGLSQHGVRGLCQYWEWTSTPMKTGRVVCGGRYRDRDAVAERTNRSWENTGGPDVAFRCVIDGEPTAVDTSRHRAG